MPLPVKWSAAAILDHENHVMYLEQEKPQWVILFLKQTQDCILSIANNPLLYPAHRRRDIRKCVVSPYITLYYRVYADEIELLRFFGNRQDPQKLGI